MADDPDYDTWTASVENRIKYTELVRDGSPSFSIENDGSTLTRQILVRWEDLNAAKIGFLGYPVIIPSQDGGGFISRYTPDAAVIFLNSSGNPYLFATKLSGQGYGMPVDASGGIHDLTDFPIYRFAKLDVTYETLTYDILSDQEMIGKGLVDTKGNPDESTWARYVTKEVRPAVEYLQLPEGSFQFVGPLTGPGSPAPVPGTPGKITPNYDLTVTWHLVPAAAVGSVAHNPNLQFPAIDMCLGSVNAFTVPTRPSNGLLAAQFALPAAAGMGYKVGDLLTVSGGSSAFQATFRVTAVSAPQGGVTCLTPLSRGLYTVSPPNPAAVAGGAGAGCMLNIDWEPSSFPVGTLLMTGAEIKPIRSTYGDRLYDLIYRFKFLPFGNQFLYYPGTKANSYTNAGYFEVTSTGASNLASTNNSPATGPVNIYPWADHNALWRVSL